MAIPYRVNSYAVQAMVNANPGMSHETATNRIINAAQNGRPIGPTAGTARPATGGTPGTGTGGGTGSAAEQWLNDILSGKNLPFNAQVQAQQLSQASDMNAAAENARNGQLDANAAAGGASARDPSMQGAKAANFARRQTDNQTSARDISQAAALGNFNAQSSAAGTLNANEMQRQQWAIESQNRQSQALMQMANSGSSNSRPRPMNEGFLQWGRPLPQTAAQTPFAPAAKPLSAPAAPADQTPSFVPPKNGGAAGGLWNPNRGKAPLPSRTAGGAPINY